MSTETALAKELEARKIVRNYMFGNAAVGLLPLPIIDLVALTGIQLKMVHSLAGLYDVEFNKEAVKGALASLAGSLGAMTVGAGIFMSALKFLPPVAMTAGFLVLPATSAAFTYAVGRVFIMHFEAGGTILSFDAKAMHHYFKDFYQEGLSVAKSEDSKTKKADPPKADTKK